MGSTPTVVSRATPGSTCLSLRVRTPSRSTSRRPRTHPSFLVAIPSQTGTIHTHSRRILLLSAEQQERIRRHPPTTPLPSEHHALRQHCTLPRRLRHEALPP